MNVKYSRIATGIVLLTFCALSIYFIFSFPPVPSKPKQSIEVGDTLRFKVRELQVEIANLKAQRIALQNDTIGFYSRYKLQLQRITNSTEQQQLQILRELIKKQSIDTKDINEALNNGLLCCELSSNLRTQLHLADSTAAICDTIIATQVLELNNANGKVKESLKKLDEVVQANSKLKRQKYRWRRAAFIEAFAISSAITIYKLTH